MCLQKSDSEYLSMTDEDMKYGTMMKLTECTESSE